MATEIELKLRLAPRQLRKLLAHPLLAATPPRRQRLLNTYYDTPELALRARRVALRFRKKGWEWLLTVKSAEPASGGLAVRNEWECAATPGVFAFSHVDAPALRNLLDELRDDLEPVFTTDFTRLTWQLACGESQIEVAIDRGSIVAGKRSEKICEIELELISGRIEDLFELARQLQHHLVLHPAIASKAEAGYRLFLDEPPRPFRAKLLPIDAAWTPVEAFRAIALSCLEHFQRNEAGLLAGGEPEFIHQARVALRRLRSALKLFAPVLPADFIAAYGQSWRTLASALGEARNWDVFREETLPPIAAVFPHDRDIRRLRNEADRRVKHARRAIVTLLGLKEYPRLMLEFTAAVYALHDTGQTPLKRFAADRIATLTRSARKMAENYGELDAEQRHEMRLRFKKLRYAMEFLGALLPPHKLKASLSETKVLQETLGKINDLVTAKRLLDTTFSKHNTGAAHGWLSGQELLLTQQSLALLENYSRIR